MKARLLFGDQDVEPTWEPTGHDDDVVRDLGLDVLVDAMAAGDSLVRTVALQCLLARCPALDDIRHRQAVVADCLDHPDEIRALYELADLGAETKRRSRLGLIGQTSSSSVLYWATGLLKELADCLDQLRAYSGAHRGSFASPGLRGLMDTIDRNLDAEYMATVRDHLKRLQFPSGVHITAELGADGMGTGYVLRRPQSVRRTWRSLVDWTRHDTFTYRIAERDDLGARTLGQLRSHGVNQVANAAAQSADHVLDFFNHLRWEIAFYVGCINLHQHLKDHGSPLCFPDAEPTDLLALDAKGLVDAGLVLRGTSQLVPNDLRATGRRLVMVTGANQGGKSTLLRAIGLAQLMTQAGMFVTAEQYRASNTRRLLTHYRREEDSALSHGKLDEELDRLSSLLDVVEPGCLMLFNESFASTNEREGSQVAKGVIEALTESGVRVVFVTHLFTLAHELTDGHAEDAVFLRAGRLSDGTRTFRLEPGIPERTSYGRDLYDDVFDARSGA
jgi:ABC-type nitrate/sulfonate/bicarbonate transport system ATPase subunit